MNMKVLIALIIGVCIVAAAGIIAFGMMNSHDVVVINSTNSTNSTNITNGTNMTNTTVVEHVNHEDTSSHESTSASKSGSNSQDGLEATLAEGRANMPAEVRARYDAREEAFARGEYRQSDYTNC